MCVLHADDTRHNMCFAIRMCARACVTMCLRDRTQYYYSIDVKRDSRTGVPNRVSGHIVSVVSQVSESAVVGFPHDLKGEGICCFVILKSGYDSSNELVRSGIRSAVGR